MPTSAIAPEAHNPSLKPPASPNKMSPAEILSASLRVASAIRLNGWWKAKGANLLAILYSVLLLTHLSPARAFPLLVAAIITIIGIGGFGHVVNDLSDMAVDAAAGKPNPLVHLAPWKRASLLLILLAVALLPWLVLPWDRLSLGLLAIEFALLLAYAIPPLRLKERGIWAVVADAGYAYALPAILAAHTFFVAAARPDNRSLLAALTLWQMALGMRHFLNHLAADRANDLRSGISTIATVKGNRHILWLIRRVLLPAEGAGFVGYLVVMSEHVRSLPWVIAGIFLLATSFYIVLAIARRYPLVTYRFSRTQLDWLYQIALPVVLLLYLVARDAPFAALLAIHLLLFAVADRGLAMQARPVACDAENLIHEVPNSTGPFFLSGEPTPTGEHATPRANIAVANINKDKYTETFVSGLVSRLHHNVYYLYGAELPTFDNEDRYFLTRRSSIHAMAHLLEVLLRRDNVFLRSSIRSYLQAKDIRLILAEFGPVGIEMLPIAQELAIPLIVNFHGYDVFNRHTVELCSSGYAALFKEAACLIGVSQIMVERLQSLGAPRNKLVHLPAFVDLGLFPYMDHSGQVPHFLAVGRFAEMKSPHLTLLAFHQVSQIIPDATLTMLGKGGGGELFEACLILARALGLENRVEFRGAVGHEEVALEMRRARVFVQHSVTTPVEGDMEGKPVAIMEAMACGLPVIATRHSGISELIEDGVTGVLVPEFDIAAMAASMIQLARDNDLVRQIGYNASISIHKDPLISRNLEIMESLIARVLAES
jgi:glycosyltransferase involved in cell wall biosynthesis